jgi:hypothetical protein
MIKRNIGFLLTLIMVFAFMTTGFTANSTDPFAAAGYTPVSDQVWASSVTASSGHSGSYSVGMHSAYGVYVDDEDKDYVGDYFNLEQKSFVQNGETNRHIDISSPVSGAYLMENLAVDGMAKIQDSFALVNHEPGLEKGLNWLVNWLKYF